MARGIRRNAFGKNRQGSAHALAGHPHVPMTSDLPFGISQYTTWPQTFEQDIALYLEAGVDFIEVCEAKLDVTDPDAQLRRLKDSGLRVSSVQPRLHSLFPDFPRPEPKSPKDRMGHLRKTIELFGRHF